MDPKSDDLLETASSPDDLPEVVAVFPLTGVLLLPGSFLPLHIFEPRYRNLLEDAVAGDRRFGLVQPLVPGPDNRGPRTPEEESETPSLYDIGCLGRIHETRTLDGGRSLVLLRGLSRFRVVEEVEPQRGYRRVRADYGEFRADLEERDPSFDQQALFRLLGEYTEARSLSIDEEVLETMSGLQLVNGLATALPFEPVEKQALLEAPSNDDRAQVLVSLLEMSGAPVHREGDPSEVPGGLTH